jgi:GT2 family glycosyltransferase
MVLNEHLMISSMEKEEIELSIVIVNYKTPVLTDICISSIFRQTKHLQFEVIVVDNDSQDNSKNLITTKFPEVNWIDSGLNAGTSVAYNIGIRASKGKYILILNSDTEFRDNAILHSLIEYKILEKTNKIGLFSCQLIGYDNIIQFNSNISFPSIKKYLRANALCIRLNMFQHKLTDEERLKLHLTAHKTKWIGIAFGIFNADICRKDNLYFDEDIFMYSDEVEWCYRLSQNGYSHHFSPIATVLHLNGGSSTFSEWRHGQVTLSEWMCFMKMKGKLYFMLCIVLILFNHLLDGLFFFKHKLLHTLTTENIEALRTRKLELRIIRRYFYRILVSYSRKTTSNNTFLKYEMEQIQAK